MLENFFFDKKKQDLSSKSSNRDDSKRTTVSSLDDSIVNATNTDVFTESLKPQDCVTILYSCMKKLKEEMNKVLHMCEKIKDSQTKDERQLNSLSEAVGLTNKFEEYERERQEKDKIIDSMKSDIVNTTEKIEELERIVDRQEQYLRRNCLLKHSIAEGERKNTDDLVLET